MTMIVVMWDVLEYKFITLNPHQNCGVSMQWQGLWYGIRATQVQFPSDAYLKSGLKNIVTQKPGY